MSKNKIGTFSGVIVPNVTMMFGVILFLRLGLIVSHTSLFETLAIIGISLGVMLMTSASIASVATNMKVGRGGIYYLVARTLGVEISGALGIALFVSQILTIALTTTAFSYLLIDIFPSLNLVFVEVGTLVVLGVFLPILLSLPLNLRVLFSLCFCFL